MVCALEELPGVKKVIASFPEKRAIVIHDGALVTTEQMCQALLKVGYVVSSKASDEVSRAVIPEESRNIDDNPMNDLVCYCFEYTRDAIEQDYIKNGRSLIMEKIAAEKKRGGCDCANKNPKGR